MVHLCHCDSMAELPEGGEVQELSRMEGAVHQLLLGVGEDPAREGLIDTPRRVAKAWLDMTRGYRQECKSAFGTALFHEPIVSAGSDGLVVVRDITFAALSEHTLLPFHGRCHIAYVPRHGVVLGLSKLARVTKCLAARLQTQQQFTERLIAAVQSEVQAKGVAAVVQAVHLGTGPAPAAQLTSAATGCFQDAASGHLQEFVSLLRLGGRATPTVAGFGAVPKAGTAAGAEAVAAETQVSAAVLPAAVAAGVQTEDGARASSMVAAAETLLQCVGEDSSRKGLKGGAARYVSWLQGATAGYRMQLPSATVSADADADPAAAAAAAAAAADLGPSTPDEHSADPSDASSDDMSADAPCYATLRERQSVVAGGSGSPATVLPLHGLEGLQTFSASFSSQCEHHLLPFYGRLKLAYLPPAGAAAAGAAASCAGASRAQLCHIVDMFSKRLQVQERLTHQVADAVVAALGVEAVLVVVESAHMCMVARGVEKHASTTLTTAARGAWVTDVAARAAALEAIVEAQQQQQHHHHHHR